MTTHPIPPYRHHAGVSRLHRYVQGVVAGDLLLQQDVTSVAQLPRLARVVVHTTSRRYAEDRRECAMAMAALEAVTGQRSMPLYAQRSVAAWKLRAGQVVGCRTTLRGPALYRFVDTLLSVVWPRLRDWGPLHPRVVAGTGAVALGMSTPVAWPPLEHASHLYEALRGLHVEVRTTAATPRLAAGLYGGVHVPTGDTP